MGLKDYFAQLAQIQESSKGFADTAEKMRQEAALSDLVQASPELMNQGDWGSLAAKAASAGDMALMRTLAATGYKAEVAPSAPKAVVTKEAADLAATQAGKAPGSFDVLVGQPMSALTGIAGLGIKKEQMGQQASQFQTAEQRRKEEVVQRQKDAASKDFEGLEKKLKDEQRAIDKVREAFKTGSLTGDAIVLNFVARNMAGEKGPLAEGDITRLTGRSFQGDTQGALNWITSASDSKAAPELRKRYEEMLQIAEKNFNQYKASEIQDQFSRALEDNSALLKDAGFKEKAKRLGGTINSDGKFEFVTKKMSVTPLSKSGEGRNAAVLVQMASAIPDPVKKKQALDQLMLFDKKVMSEEVYKKFEERIRASGGK
jgi:hypothetical protein